MSKLRVMGERSQPKKLEASAYLWTESAGSGSNSKNGDYFIMHPLGYFASAPNGTSDAAILKEMVSRYSGYLERLDSEQKLGLGALLSYYKFYKLKYKSLYTVSDALIDAMPLCTKVSIHNLLLTHEGISNDSALGLIKFLTSRAPGTSSDFRRSSTQKQN
jgi:hypothetical protein